MRKNENGFSVVETLLILVILGLIGGVGWYVWSARNAEDAKIADSTIVKAAKAQTLDELGIEITYPDSWGEATTVVGPLIEPASGGYTQVIFSKEKRININFINKAYDSPLDGCGIDDPAQQALYSQYSTQASVGRWSGDIIYRIFDDRDDSGSKTIAYDFPKTSPGGLANWTEVARKDKVLSYRDIDSEDTRVQASTGDDGCAVITQAEADAANAYLTYYRYVVNFTNDKVLGTNAQFDTRQGDDETVRSQLIDVLNSIK